MRGSVFHALNRFGERSETFIADAITDLDALGWKAWVASAHPPVNRDEFPFPPEERFLAPCRPPAIRRAAARLKTREARLRWAEWWRPVMEALEPDVIQLHFGWTAAAFALERFGIPIVVSFHGSDVRSWPHEEVANQRVYEELFGYLRYATASSQSLAQDIRELGFRGRLEVIPPGVHLDSFRFRPPRETVDITNLLFVGRQVSCKGLDVLLTALRDVVQQRLEVRLVVIGDGPDATRNSALSTSLGLDSFVEFRGSQAHDEVLRALQQADILIVPSRTSAAGEAEGSGLAPKEAFAVGVPVIATDCGGLPETMPPSQRGELVPEGDPAALARGILELLARPERWRQKAVTAREWVEVESDASKLTERTARLYEDMRDERER